MKRIVLCAALLSLWVQRSEGMALNKYHLEDHWDVPFPIEDVWEVLARPREFPVWWQGVYLSVESLDGSGNEPKV
jgi:hypothetical protein